VVAPLLAFAGVSAVVIMTPGPDTVVTIGGTLSGGRRGGVLTALGVFCGQAVWTLAASAGISALLVASAPAFLTVKYLGAAYLVFLGLQALWSATRHRQASGPEPADRPPASGPSCASGPSPAGGASPAGDPRPGGWGSFRRGLLSDLSNPKMAVFFTGLLPQSGSSFAALVLLGLLFCTMTFGWLCCYSLAVARMGDLLRRSRIRRTLDAATGAVLVAFGLRIAIERS
jgi:threonine/homoserine/homoserine lactone efflux protein